MRLLLLTAFLSGTVSLFAESRTWKSADGGNSFTGEYVSHTDSGVTIRREDGKVFTVDYAKLHPDEKTWVTTQSATAGKKPAAAEPEVAPDPNAVFDTLCFGDTTDTVKKKLKESKAVETTLDESYMARTGLNGVYRTRQKIGGLHCELFFDWTPVQTLSEVVLQTQAQRSDAYAGNLQATWAQLVELMTTLHGKPVQGGAYPGINQVKDDMFLPTHLWKLKSGGSALLGVSSQGGGYLVVVRFTKDKVEPARY
ncbi:hypothetical protein OKA04_07680 [Luteolibacter flavescens]|uniref:SLA1 homology domain-containing protein n=1 Tax=Luteolibacter flavescens TaxID=1859460 RepID=A0ABT3FMP1_9BACT|nr:hypothetical protein [Luteolibacter flavescens]MCW1884609.1 hypothetical protein [Luteolibacter flavescens]